MLSLGASKPWKEVMAVMTGEPRMDTAAFREYFMPLENWLKEENARNGVHVGWKTKNLDHYCKPGLAAGGSRAVPSAAVALLAATLMAVFFK